MTRNTYRNPSSMDTQFPHPTRPFNSYDITNCSSPLNTNSLNVKISELQDEQAKNCMDTIIEDEEEQLKIQPEEEEEQEEKSKDAEKLLRSIFEVYQKLPEKMQRKIDYKGKIDQFFEERALKQENITHSLRGIKGFDTKEEIGHRLERIKIRTLNPTGVEVKQENKK